MSERNAKYSFLLNAIPVPCASLAIPRLSRHGATLMSQGGLGCLAERLVVVFPHGT